MIVALLLWTNLLAAAEVLIVSGDSLDERGLAARPAHRVGSALTDVGIVVRELAAEKLIESLNAAEPGTILVLVDASWFPVDAVPALQAFLRRSNHFIAIGGPPFVRFVKQREGRWAEIEKTVAAVPVLESISPAYKLHPVQATALSSSVGEPPFPFVGEVAASIPRAPGFGCDALRKRRQIPLGYALDSGGKRRGIAAHLLLNSEGEYARSVWGYLGVSSAGEFERTSTWSIPLLVSMVQRIQAGSFLSNAGVREFAVAAGESTSLGAYVTNLAAKPADLEVRFTVTSMGRVVHTASRTLHLKAGRAVRSQFIAGDAITLPAGRYEVTTTLAGNGTTMDAISYPFEVVAFGPLKDDEIVAVRDGDFYLAGKKWYPLGINYWPRYILGVEPADFSDAQWDSSQYDPMSVEEDLSLAEALGLSMISIQYNRPEQAGPVMDLLTRAHRHHLKVHVYMPGLDPLHPDFPRAEALIRAARLPESPAVFAYDLGWEVRVGLRSTRAVWDRAWEQWVADRYGSVDAAERDWNYAPGRDNGVLVGASDEQLKHEGPWRVYVAAYRRFWDDTISRGYREVREKVRSLDAHHLLGARSGYGGTGAEWIAEHLPFDLASGAKHLDFICPEHYEFSKSRAEFLKSAFTTAYARLVSGGKPVYWAEFGRPVAWKVEPAAYPWRADPAALRAQGDYFRNVIEMVHDGRANGCAGWWWPAGYRVDEKSDFGIVGPDLTLRPAAEELARAAKWFFEPLAAARFEGELTIDRDRYVTGYAGVYGAHSATYAETFASGRVPRLRTGGTGTDSARAPLVAVGDVPGNGSNPPKYLNAEFNLLRLNGRIVRDGDALPVEPGQPVVVEASVGNTAEAIWLARTERGPGGVYLALRWEGQEVLGAIESDTPFLHDARVSEFAFTPKLERPMSITFKMTARGRTDFGEVIRVTLQPIAPAANRYPGVASSTENRK